MLDLTMDPLGNLKLDELKLVCPNLYNYNPIYDAACIMGEDGSDDQLLISFRGRSAIFSLENARGKYARL